MAYDLFRRETSPRNWSRGHDVGTVGREPGDEHLGRRLLVPALAGAAAAAGWLLWSRSRARAKPVGPIGPPTMFMTVSPSGRVMMSPVAARYYGKR